MFNIRYIWVAWFQGIGCICTSGWFTFSEFSKKKTLFIKKVTWTVDILAVSPTSVGNDEVERFWIIERFRISKDFCSVINHDQKWILCLNGIKRIAGTFMKEHLWDILETTKNSIHKFVMQWNIPTRMH